MSLTHDDWMDIAWMISMHSTCEKLHVGALLVRDRRIISTGYNGAPSGMPHCYHPESEELSTTCEKAVHAEANAIAFAARHGVGVRGSVLYTTTFPCYTCACLVVNAGVEEVIYAEEYRSARGTAAFGYAGVQVERYRGSWMQAVSIARGHRTSLYPDEPSEIKEPVRSPIDLGGSSRSQ